MEKLSGRKPASEQDVHIGARVDHAGGIPEHRNGRLRALVAFTLMMSVFLVACEPPSDTPDPGGQTTDPSVTTTTTPGSQTTDPSVTATPTSDGPTTDPSATMTTTPTSGSPTTDPSTTMTTTATSSSETTEPPEDDQGGTGERSCPALPAYPTPACTGVPPGTKLVPMESTLNGDSYLDGDAYHARNPGEVLDGIHFAGDLVVRAPDVIIRNSVIEGFVVNDYSADVYPFKIEDSTVGPAEGCNSAPAVGVGDYSATRIFVRNHGDGFRATSDNVTIRDSFVDLCSNPEDHSDGVQTYTDGQNLTFDHNTIDQRGVVDMNSPIFIGDGWAGVSVTNNLVAGGTYSIQVMQLAGTAIVQGNRVVADSWVYGPVSSECAKIEWSDNQLVRIDDDYRVTSIVGPVECY